MKIAQRQEEYAQLSQDFTWMVTQIKAFLDAHEESYSHLRRTYHTENIECLSKRELTEILIDLFVPF